MDGEQLTYTIVVDKQTGALNVLASEFGTAQQAAGGASEKTQEFGNKGSDALSKIESRASRMAISLLVVQVVFAELTKLVKESTSFQELQGTFEKMAEGLGKDLGPSLEIISTGLQGVIIMAGGLLSIVRPLLDTIIHGVAAAADNINGVIGAALNLTQGNFRGAMASIKDGVKDGANEFKGLGTEYMDAFKKIGDAGSAAMDRLDGKTKQATANSVEALSARLKNEEAHLTAETALLNAVDSERAARFNASEATKLEVIKRTNERELELLEQVEAMKRQVLEAQRAAGKITLQKYNEEILSLEQTTRDKELAILQKEAAEEVKIEDEKQKKVQAVIQKQMDVFSAAAAQRFTQTHDVQAALRAGGAAEIKEISSQAASAINIYGAKAAAASFANAGGYPLGIPAALATAAYYATLAAVVGAAGGELASMADPGGASGATSTPGNSGAGTSAAGSTSAPSGGVITAASSSSQASIPPINVYVDGQVLFNIISGATRDGKLLIYASAVK